MDAIQLHFDAIFEINNATDILRLPNVTAKRKALIKLYKAGSEESPQAEDEYIDLVNGLCEQYGLPPHFIRGPAGPAGPQPQTQSKVW